MVRQAGQRRKHRVLSRSFTSDNDSSSRSSRLECLDSWQSWSSSKSHPAPTRRGGLGGWACKVKRPGATFNTQQAGRF